MGHGAAEVGHVASLASGFVPAAVLAEEAWARFVLAGEGDRPRSRLRRSREPNGSAASGGRPKWPAGPPGTNQPPRGAAPCFTAADRRAIVKTLTVAILATALSAVSAAHGPWAQYWSQNELISYQLPSAWQVQDEHSLEESGYLSAPYPPYTLIAGAEPATLAGVPNPPSGYALSETLAGWVGRFTYRQGSH